MNIPANKYLLHAFSVACRHSYDSKFTDKVTQEFMQEALELIIPKLSKAKVRISPALTLHPVIITRNTSKKRVLKKEKTINLNLNKAQTFVLKTACETWQGTYPDSVESANIKLYFLSPIYALSL